MADVEIRTRKERSCQSVRLRDWPWAQRLEASFTPFFDTGTCHFSCNVARKAVVLTPSWVERQSCANPTRDEQSSSLGMNFCRSRITLHQPLNRPTWTW